MDGTTGTRSLAAGTTGKAPDRPKLDPIFVGVDDAAAALSLSRREVYRLMDDNEIESVERGRRRLIVVVSLNAYADRLREEATARRSAPVGL